MDSRENDLEALKERNNRDDISHFQCSPQLIPSNQGRRASRFPLAIKFAPLALRPTGFRLLGQGSAGYHQGEEEQ